MRIDGIGLFVPQDARSRETWQRIGELVTRAGSAAFSRDQSTGGHVTGSVFLLSSDGSSALLMHHVKLNRWLQPGGHCDGIADVPFVALKEAYEESGLTRIRLVSDNVLDLDIHDIPATPREPAHLLYDIRFLAIAEAGEITASAESDALAWVPLDRLEDYTTADSVLRLRDAARDQIERRGG